MIRWILYLNDNFVYKYVQAFQSDVGFDSSMHYPIDTFDLFL